METTIHPSYRGSRVPRDDQGGPRGTNGDPDNRWRLHISSISHTGWQPRAQDILSQNQDAINLIWWVCGYISEYFRHHWCRISAVDEALSEIMVCVFLLWEILLIGIYLPMTPVTTTIYICFAFTTFPSLRHLVGTRHNDKGSRRNDQIRKATSRGMPLWGARQKLTMKWPLIKGQARPDPETHKWRKLLWPLLPPPLHQINQFGLSAVHPFDACYQRLK